MRDLAKRTVSLSWAMSLFGAERFTDMFKPETWRRTGGRAGKTMGAVTDAVVDQLGSTAQKTFESGDQLQEIVVDTMFAAVPSDSEDGDGSSEPATEDSSASNSSSSDGAFKADRKCDPAPRNPNEQVMILYTSGAEDLLITPDPFDADGRLFFRIRGNLCKGDKRVGRYDAVWGGDRAHFHDFRDWPLGEQVPAPPFDKLPPNEWNPPTNCVKARWKLDRQGEIYFLGRSMNRASGQKSTKTTMMWMGAAGVIVGGTGRYKDARGMASSVGSVDLSKPPTAGNPDPSNLTHVLKFLL